MAILFTILKLMASFGGWYSTRRAKSCEATADELNNKATSTYKGAQAAMQKAKAACDLLGEHRAKKAAEESDKTLSAATAYADRWEKWSQRAEMFSTLLTALRTYGGRKVPYAAGVADVAIVCAIFHYAFGVDMRPVLQAIGATLSRLPMLG